MGRSKPFFLTALILAFCLVLGLAVFGAILADEALAQPNLLVSTPNGKVLLGGQATVRITVTNNGDERGYNLGVTAVMQPPDVDKTVSYVSASGPDGPLTPTSVSTDPVTGDLTVSFDDIRDLVPTESTTIAIVVDISDLDWSVGDDLTSDAEAQVNTRADGGGTWLPDPPAVDSGVITLIPFDLESKSANQSTADWQATGCGELPGHAGEWPYSYTLTVQNNYVNPSDNMTVTDVLPDGVEYLGPIAVPPTTVNRDIATGETTLFWDIGTMNPGDTWTAQYQAGVRYDYYGTVNGGTNRPYDDYGLPLGTPIPDGTSLQNNADLYGEYFGVPETDSDSASVTAGYATISKGGVPGTVGIGDTVTFTLTYTTSEYYNLDNLVVTDVVPDGLTYDVGSAAPQQPDIIQNDTPGPGETTLTWNTLPDIGSGSVGTITFTATVDATWEDPPDPEHTWIVAGDSMCNEVTLDADWHDEVDLLRTGSTHQSSSCSTLTSGPRPEITKEVAPDSGGSPGAFADTIDSTVGDRVWFRVRINTNDGATPITDDVQFGNVDVIDWIPQGTQYEGPSTLTYSDASDFNYNPPTPKFSALYDDQPEPISSGSLEGYAWSLGNVESDGWWQVVFPVTVEDDPAVADGAVVYNYGKCDGENSGAYQYSDRDIAQMNYTEPDLSVVKDHAALPSPFGVGSSVDYSVTVTNGGTATAHNVLVVDTLHPGMRDTNPSGTVAVTLDTVPVNPANYLVGWNGSALTVDLEGGATETAIPAGSTLVVTYTGTVDSDVGAFADLTNNVDVTWSSQPETEPVRRDYGPVSDSDTVQLPDIEIAKEVITPPGDTRTIGESATYRITVTVPARNIAYAPEVIDQVRTNGMLYVSTPTSVQLSDDGSSPAVGAVFSDGSTDMDPSVNYGTPDPGATFTWDMQTAANDLIDNSNQGTDYVFWIDFELTVNGLVDETGANDPSNWNWWPNTGGDPTADNLARDRGRFRWDPGADWAVRTLSTALEDTHVLQPYLVLDKTNDTPPPATVKGGDTVNYTITVTNNGLSTAFDNLVVDTLADGMRATLPTVNSVTLNGAPLGVGVDYSYAYVPGTGVQTFGFDGGTSQTNFAAGDVLIIQYTATVDGEVGSGAQLTNDAYVEYASLDEIPAGCRWVREGDDSSGGNTDDSTVQTRSSTVSKTIMGPNPAIIGDEVTFELEITVPEDTVLYDPEIIDTINQDGFEYIDASCTSTLSYVSGPDQGASFEGGVSTPDKDYYSPNPGATFTWNLNEISNAAGGADYVFKLTFELELTGVIDPAGDPADPGNWRWWWATGGDPTINNTAVDRGTIAWNDGTQERSSNSGNETTNVHQPNLVMDKSNSAGGPVTAGSTIDYTLDVTNDGLSTAYDVIVVDTLDEGMRDNDPSASVIATLDPPGPALIKDTDYTVNWDNIAGELTVDFANSPVETPIPSGSVLQITYTGTVDDDVGAGATLQNIASAEFNSQVDGSGRQVERNSDPAQQNTDDSTADVPDATIAKTQDAPDDECTMAQPFTYTVAVTVPANTSIYDASVTDTIVDGFTVDGTQTYLDGVPQAIGTVTVTPLGDGTTLIGWDMGDHQNATASDEVLSLDIDVHMDDTFNDGTPINGVPPGQDIFGNSADLAWDDAETGGTTHSDSDNANNVTAVEPYMDMVKTNDAAGPIQGGDVVSYTLTVTNNGTSTSYKNIVVDTIPDGMRGNPPSITSVTLDGAPLSSPGDYTVNWDSGSGELTLDFDKGVSQTNVPEGQALVIEYTATVDDPAGSGGTLENVASIGYNSWNDGSGRQTDRTGDPADHNTDDSSIEVQSASFAKSEDAAGDVVSIGSEYTYTVSVTVPTSTTIYNTEVDDTIEDGLTVTDADTLLDGVPQAIGTVTVTPQGDGTTDINWDIGDWTNNTGSPQVLSLEIDVRVDDTYQGGAPVTQGDVFSNSADLQWEDKESGGTVHNETNSADDVTVREPSLAVTKLVDGDTPEAGDTLLYTIQIDNNGNWPAYEVTVNDSIDPSLTYVPSSITGPGADDSGAPNLSWDIGTIDPSPPTITLTYQVTVDGGVSQGATIPNSATVPSYWGQPQPDPDAREYGPVSGNRDVTARAPVLGVDKTVDNPNPSWYETVTYTITITNNGDADASNVDVSDTIPSPHFSYVNGTTNASWPGTPSYTNDPAGAPGPDLAWDTSATLAPTESLVLEFDMMIEQWAAYGTHTNTAYGDGEDGAGTALPQASDTQDIDVDQEYGITLTKELQDDDGFIPVGEDFGYKITVTNVGNTTVPVVPLEDFYNDAYLEFQYSDPLAPDTQDPGHLVWDDITDGNELAPQEVAELTVTFRGLQTGTTPDTDNRVTVNTTDSEGNPITGDTTDNTLTLTDPGISVTKTLNGETDIVPVGAEFGYTIHVENTGDTVIPAPIILEDIYDSEYMAYKSATPSPTMADPGDLFWLDASGGAGLLVGQSLDVVVNFTAVQPGRSPETDNNVAVVGFDEHGDPVTDGDTEPSLIITGPKISIEKKLASEIEEIKVGDEVTFEIVVENSGDTEVVAPVPVKDNYNNSYWGYVGADPEPDDSKDDGEIDWPDISDGKGMKVGASKKLTITFVALQEGSSPFTDNKATFCGAYDQYGDQVPCANVDLEVSIGKGKVMGSTYWYLAEGSTGGGFDTWILLQNSEEETAHVDVTFATHDGPREPVPVTMEPDTRATVRIQDYVPEDFHVSTIVESDIPVVAERSMYWDKRFWGESSAPGGPQPYEMKGGHANLGVAVETLLGAAWSGRGRNARYFPEGATAGGFDTWILLVNPNGQEAVADVTLMTGSGVAAEEQVLVPPLSRQTVHIDDHLPDAYEVATEVVSNVPLVAERSMYWDPEETNLEPYEMRGGHSNAGSPTPDNEWFLSEGSTGEGFETFILLQNPQDRQAKVTATFMDASGVADQQAFTMPARSRETLRVSDFVPANFHVSTRVVSDLPVVAERSMYWDKRTTAQPYAMRDGHSNVGSVLTGGIWMVPEGSTGGGFDSWVLITNTGAEDAVVAITFMTHYGPMEPVMATIPASSRYTVRLSDYIPDDFHISTLVESDSELVVERAMYWDNREILPDHPYGIEPYEMMGGHSAGGVDP